MAFRVPTSNNHTHTHLFQFQLIENKWIHYCLKQKYSQMFVQSFYMFISIQPSTSRIKIKNKKNDLIDGHMLMRWWHLLLQLKNILFIYIYVVWVCVTVKEQSPLKQVIYKKRAGRARMLLVFCSNGVLTVYNSTCFTETFLPINWFLENSIQSNISY